MSSHESIGYAHVQYDVVDIKVTIAWLNMSIRT